MNFWKSHRGGQIDSQPPTSNPLPPPPPYKIPQNNSDTVKSEAENTRLEKEIPKERYISLEKIIDNLRLT